MRASVAEQARDMRARAERRGLGETLEQIKAAKAAHPECFDGEGRLIQGSPCWAKAVLAREARLKESQK